MFDLRLFALSICGIGIALAAATGHASAREQSSTIPATTSATEKTGPTTEETSATDRPESQVWKRYYTTDTSSEEAALKAKFLDHYAKVPPFSHDGKVAVAALVYSCDGGRTERIAYFTRYSPEAKRRIEDARQKLEEAKKAGKAPPPEFVMGPGMDGTEMQVKLVGSPDWLSGVDALKAMAEFQFPCSGEQLLILPAQ